MDVKSALDLKIDLLLNGVTLDGKFDFKLTSFFKQYFRWNPLIVFKDIYVTVSINNKSPYILYRNKADNIIYLKGNNIIPMEVKVIPEGKYFGKKSSDGILMEDIGTFQTDRLRISAYKGCNFVMNNEGCKFCEHPIRELSAKIG